MRATAGLGARFGRAVPLVRSVTTVVLLVATVRHGDALGVLTGELSGAARAVLSIAFDAFITAVAAVVIVVARPVGVDAPTFNNYSSFNIHFQCSHYVLLNTSLSFMFIIYV